MERGGRERASGAGTNDTAREGGGGERAQALAGAAAAD